MKTLMLHSHAGPNGWKVALVLEELSIPYDTKIWATGDQKKPPFTTILNPNGFTPVLEDPNTDVLLWESGAIIDHSQSGKSQANLFFQCTFQGPILSGAFRFTRFTPSPDARRYYVRESIRVLQVLEGELEGKEWLTGGKCTGADLVFAPYMWSMDSILEDDKPALKKDFPNVNGWLQRMSMRDSIKKVKPVRDQALAAAFAAQQTRQK